MYPEFDPKPLKVLEAALHSSSRVVRLRAVCMLTRVWCEAHAEWLGAACDDPEPSVSQTAAAVRSWTMPVETPPWPQREDPAFDRKAELTIPEDALETAAGLRWEWEYVVEVWREDAMLVGVFLCTTCQEDAEHAKKIALGQAILASIGPAGDVFEPSTAAAFIVAKRRVRREDRPTRRGKPRRAQP